jgi:HAD superfamily hydrolase (TIGR01509 family)
MVAALLFDFDGTIVDSEGPAFRSWQEVYRAHGQELPLERWVACVGTIGGFDPLEDLEGRIGRQLDRERIQEARLRRKLQLVGAENMRPGVEAYIRGAREMGLRIGIVTSGPREWVTDILSRLGRSDGWDCILCADHEQSIAKPDPHLYREALAELAIEPSQAIAIEDSPNGIAAAKGAGLFCLAVPNPVTSALDLNAADVQIDSLAELPLEELLELAER